MTKESTEGIAQAILALADEISARLIVCGQRGRSPLRTALLGSVSQTLAAYSRRPVLIASGKVPSPTHGTPAAYK